MTKLKRMREAMGVSQEELAAAAGVSQGAISMIENGTRKPSYDVLLKIAVKLDCLVDELIDRPDLVDDESA